MLLFGLIMLSLAIVVVSVLLSVGKNGWYILLSAIMIPIIVVPFVIASHSMDYKYYTKAENESSYIYFNDFRQSGQCVTINDAYTFDFGNLKYNKLGNIIISIPKDSKFLYTINPDREKAQKIVPTCQ